MIMSYCEKLRLLFAPEAEIIIPVCSWERKMKNELVNLANNTTKFSVKYVFSTCIILSICVFLWFLLLDLFYDHLNSIDELINTLILILVLPPDYRLYRFPSYLIDLIPRDGFHLDVFGYSISDEISILIPVIRLMQNAMLRLNVRGYIHTDFLEGFSDAAIHGALIVIDLSLGETVLFAVYVFDQQYFRAAWIDKDAAVSRDFLLIIV